VKSTSRDAHHWKPNHEGDIRERERKQQKMITCISRGSVEAAFPAGGNCPKYNCEGAPKKKWGEVHPEERRGNASGLGVKGRTEGGKRWRSERGTGEKRKDGKPLRQQRAGERVGKKHKEGLTQGQRDQTVNQLESESLGGKVRERGGTGYKRKQGRGKRGKAPNKYEVKVDGKKRKKSFTLCNVKNWRQAIKYTNKTIFVKGEKGSFQSKGVLT